MTPVVFEEVNTVMGKGQKEYSELHCFVDRTDERTPTTMCFALSEEERKQVAETGEIWLTILTFNQPFPPISSSCSKPTFNK